MEGGRWVSVTTTGLAILVFIVMFICKYLLKTKRSSNVDPELPRGPSPWPIIGNLHMLGELPHRALKDLAHKYGPIMLLRLGSVRTVVVSSPDMAKQFLRTHDLIFASRPTLTAGKHLFYDCKDVAFAPYGDYWKRMRKICVVELLSPRRIESLQSVRNEEMSEMIHSIWHESENGAKAVNLRKALSSLSANIICRTLMGRKYSREAPDKLAGIKGLPELMRTAQDLIGAFDIGDFIPFLGWFDLQGIRRRMRKVRREFDALVEEIIDAHTESRKKNERANGGREKDFVEVLLDLSENASSSNIVSGNDIKALLLEMLMAGTDTTSVTIEWAMFETLKNPAVSKKVQDELVSAVGKDGRVKPRDLPSLVYLQSVVKETLRLHPTLPLLVPHESMEVCSAAGYRIPAKTRLIVNAWAIGRDPDAWGDDALAFKPERFMQGGTHQNIDVSGQHFELIPFGSGRRACPGMGLALEVLTLALAHLFHCFDWTLECREELNTSEEKFGMVMPPRFQVFAVPRQKLQASV